MNAPVLVKHLALADEVTSRWLNSMLAPAVEACNFENVPGVRIVPLSGPGRRYRGQVQQFNCEWMIELSISAGFWRKEQILHTYIHECAHLLVIHEERARKEFASNHGPIFFLTNLVLASRVDAAGNGPASLLRLLCLYDFQDCPLDGWKEEAWRSAVVKFAFKHYRRLAEAELSAESVAREAWRLWEIEHTELIAEKKALAQEAEEKERLLGECKSLRRHVAELERQRNVSFAWRFLFITDWPGVVVTGTFLGGIAACFVFAVGYSLGAHRVFS